MKIADCYSGWLEVIKGTLQGSAHGTMIFNIFIKDMYSFFKLSELCNYTDDNTLSVIGKNVKYVIDTLKYESEIAIQWFANNFMEVSMYDFG